MRKGRGEERKRQTVQVFHTLLFSSLTSFIHFLFRNKKGSTRNDFCYVSVEVKKEKGVDFFLRCLTLDLLYYTMTLSFFVTKRIEMEREVEDDERERDLEVFLNFLRLKLLLCFLEKKYHPN